MDAIDQSTTNIYFAAKPMTELAPILMDKIENFYSFLSRTGQLEMYRHCYDYYYRSILKGARLTTSGEQDEFVNMNVNHFRNLLSHLRTFTTQQRPAFEPQAINTDYSSQAQTILAGGLLEYYLKQRGLEINISSATELALMLGEGWIQGGWDDQDGSIYAVDPTSGQPVRTGDITYSTKNPIEVVRDCTKSDQASHDWFCVRNYVNRFTLKAKYPELAEKINALPSKSISLRNRLLSTQTYNYDEDTDDVVVWVFYHRQTAALPLGRLMMFCDADCVVLDGKLPYRNIPLWRINPDERIENGFGCTVAFDLLPIQEALDKLYSTVLTNQSNFGVQNVLSARGANATANMLSGGLNMIEWDSKFPEPKALNLTQTPPEIFNFIQGLVQVIETISGVNSVARGNPEASLKSGAALALVQSMAIQFSQSLQQSYARLLEEVGTGTLEILQDFAEMPRIATIVGKSKRSMVKEFSKKDIDKVSRVMVRMGNPMSQTVAGRVNLAENLIQNKLITTAQEYLMVLQTGQLDPLIEGDTAELLAIRSENEELMEGRSVPVVITDSHVIHIQEHKAVLANPDARRNPKLVAIVTEHLMGHINQLKTGDKDLLQLLGNQPIVPPMQTPAQGNMPGAGQAPAALDATNPTMQAAQEVGLPGPPNNPLTGENAPLPTIPTTS